MRRAFTLIELLVVIAIIAILVGLLGDVGGLIALCIGWIRYPIRLASERYVNWPEVYVCVGCLAGLTVGVHLFGRWFAASRPTPTSWPWSRTFKLISLLMLMFLAGITAIGVTHQFVWLATTTEPLTTNGTGLAAKFQARNHMKQNVIAVAVHHDVHNILPAGGTFDASGRGMHGWQTFLLPYLEQEPLFKKINLTLPWNDPKNEPAMKEEPYLFMHPLIGPKPAHQVYGLSHFAGNIHVLGAKPMELKDITDGQSNTILLGEVAHNFKPWGMPMNCRDPSVGLNGPHGFASPRGGFVAFALVDGSTRVIAADVSPAVLKALSTPRGGEPVPQDE